MTGVGPGLGSSGVPGGMVRAGASGRTVPEARGQVVPEATSGAEAEAANEVGSEADSEGGGGRGAGTGVVLDSDTGDEPAGAEPDAVPAGRGSSWRARAGAAVRERLPLWAQALQARCGLERRSAIALVVILVAAVAFAVHHFWTGRVQPVRAPEVVQAAVPSQQHGMEEPAAPATGSPPASGAAVIVVDVTGKVRKPGLQRLPLGSRVADALQAAGGVRPGASTDGLNRARLLADGEQVVVGEPVAAAGGGPPGASGSGSTAAGTGGPAPVVSLNTATVEQLDALPGVGPVLARHIIDYRTQHSGFRSVDELREVHGIGDRRFADLQNRVRP